ncbi:hypothetical protein SAMN06269173_104472 [Hymenobacter mucosus]|uniref:Uncharacterized protein n=1 Tax=Hymenobacter mucosus TaxID=1411120 RepID=A0A238XYR8_9BACT|nr:hypothetical protein SAMN06269173_104472 [Hymenobacter mucosus]
MLGKRSELYGCQTELIWLTREEAALFSFICALLNAGFYKKATYYQAITTFSELAVLLPILALLFFSNQPGTRLVHRRKNKGGLGTKKRG